MTDLIYIIVLVVLPIIMFISLYFEFIFNKKKVSKKFILTNVALLIYLLGMLTSVSLSVAMIVVYVLFVFIKVYKV